MHVFAVFLLLLDEIPHGDDEVVLCTSYGSYSKTNTRNGNNALLPITGHWVYCWYMPDVSKHYVLLCLVY